MLLAEVALKWNNLSNWSSRGRNGGEKEGRGEEEVMIPVVHRQLGTHTHTQKRQNTDNIHTITVTEKSMPTRTHRTQDKNT